MHKKNKVIDKISDLMRLKNVTQAEISERIGVSKPTISNFFQGKSDLRAKSLEQILKYLGVDIVRAINETIIKGVSVNKNSHRVLINDVEILLNSLEKTPRNAVLKTLLKVSSRLKDDEEIKAQESIKQYIKSQT
ncbi:MAG: helix-turn-helix domain-containing protein [Bdellovibrio sp.]